MLLVLTLTFTLLTWLNRRIGGSLLYPAAAFSAIWGICFALLWLSGPIFFRITDDTLVFYACGAIAFSAGGFCSTCFSSRSEQPILYARLTMQHESDRVNIFVNYILMGLAIGVPFYWKHVVDVASQSIVPDFWVALRTQMIAAGEDTTGQFRLMDNLVVLSLIVALIAYYNYDGKSRASALRAWGAVILAFVYTLMTASRSSSIALVLSLVALDWMKHGRLSRRMMVVLSMLFLFAFSVLSVLLQKGEARKDASFVENVPALADGFLWYSLGGIVAFDQIYQQPTVVPAVQNIDRPVLMALNKFGERYSIPSEHAEYVPIGPQKDMNIFTFYYSYLPEFGVVGSLFIVFLLGSGVTLLYRIACSGNAVATIVYSVIFAGILLSVYAEELILNSNFMFKSMLVTFLLFRLARKRVPRYGLASLPV